MAPVHNITRNTGKSACYHCGGKHNPLACRHRESSCHNCGRKGHLAKKCLNSQQVHAHLPLKPPPHTQQPLFKNAHSYLETDSFTEGVECIVDNSEQGLDDDDNVCTMFTLPSVGMR